MFLAQVPWWIYLNFISLLCCQDLLSFFLNSQWSYFFVSEGLASCIELNYWIYLLVPNAFLFLLAISVFISESVENITCRDLFSLFSCFILKKKILFPCFSSALLAFPMLFFLRIKRTHSNTFQGCWSQAISWKVSVPSAIVCISVADSDPGSSSFWPLDQGSGMGK